MSLWKPFRHASRSCRHLSPPGTLFNFPSTTSTAQHYRSKSFKLIGLCCLSPLVPNCSFIISIETQVLVLVLHTPKLLSNAYLCLPQLSHPFPDTYNKSTRHLQTVWPIGAPASYSSVCTLRLQTRKDSEPMLVQPTFTKVFPLHILLLLCLHTHRLLPSHASLSLPTFARHPPKAFS